MIDAALDACLRRRQQVFKYYELKEQHLRSAQSLAQQDLDETGPLRIQHAALSKRVEEALEKVSESRKVLETELKLFRQQKEQELKQLVSEFVRIQKKSNEKMKNSWQQFLSKSEISKEVLG